MGRASRLAVDDKNRTIGQKACQCPKALVVIMTWNGQKMECQEINMIKSFYFLSEERDASDAASSHFELRHSN